MLTHFSVTLYVGRVQSAASDLGLQCLQIALLGVSRLKWVKDRGKKTPVVYFVL